MRSEAETILAEARVRGAALALTLALVGSAPACIDIDLTDELNWLDAGPEAGDGGDGAPPPGPSPPDGGWDGSWWPPPADGAPPDTTPPWLVSGGACAVTEVPLGPLCASAGQLSLALRLWASEPVVAFARVEPGGVITRSDLPGLEHHLVLRHLDPGAELSLTVEVEDGAGLTATEGPFDARTEPAGPTVVLSEILFDPLGDEPHQEFVELHNHGTSAVSLDGWALADEGGEDLLSAPTPLPPGGFAVVVSDRYAPGAGGDPPPASGAMVLRLESAIGSSGLRNSGERLTLTDGSGAIVSVYPCLESPPAAGASVERVDAMAPDGDPLNWAASPTGRSTPGGPNDASGATGE